MFLASERLPHLLPTSAYWAEEFYTRESERIFERSWHFVGLTTELSQSGQFITTEICNRPIQVRNIDGTFHVISNVCAHRHCLLTSEKHGCSDEIRCQYHGWEYDCSGKTKRIPAARNFAPLDRSSVKIETYRVEVVGSLIFVNLDADAADLKTSLGDSFQAIERGFGMGWLPMFSGQFTQQVNWKIPIENSLEAYHVPTIHPETFRVDPGEERSEHRSNSTGSQFNTTLPFAAHSKMDAWFQRMEGRIVRHLIGEPPTCQYEQHQVFPNLLFSFTDMVSLLHVVRPTGPQTCISSVVQFGRCGSSGISQLCCRLWGRLAASVSLKILKEDFQLFPDIQRGLKASTNEGMLGRCEERIYLFQKWLLNQIERDGNPDFKSSMASVVSCHCDSPC